jgi:hypothetical protein
MQVDQVTGQRREPTAEERIFVIREKMRRAKLLQEIVEITKYRGHTHPRSFNGWNQHNIEGSN